MNNLGERIITVFSNIRDKDNPHYVSVDYILNRMKNCKIQDKIDQLRKETNPVRRRALKDNLPSICFSGKFRTRHDVQLIEHSGCCILDFDHVGDVEAKKDELKQYPFIYSAFGSPSGDGVKAVVAIPANALRHAGHYLALRKHFPEMDNTSRNLSRVCYESIDANIHINPNAEEFTEYIHEEKPEASVPVSDPYNRSVDKGAYKVKTIAEMIRNSTDGNKHNTLLKASRLAGGYIASGVLDESYIIRILEYEIQQKDIVSFTLAQKTIRGGIRLGKAIPIFDTTYSR